MRSSKQEGFRRDPWLILGHALVMEARYWRRFGFCISLLVSVAGQSAVASPFTISAPTFAQGKPIPGRYSYANQNCSPELRIENIPANAKSLVLIVDDPDSPSGLWTHWLIWNLPPATTSIPEGNKPSGSVCEGKNSFGHVRYDGPAPPNGTGIHRYFFHLYAMDVVLSLPSGVDRAALLAAMEGHIVSKTETFGIYQYGAALPGTGLSQ